MTTAVVSLSADLSALRRDLALIPNLTGAEAQKSLIALERMVAKAEKAAKASAQATAKASKEASAAAEKAAKESAAAMAKADEEASKSRKEGLKGLAEFAGLDVGPLEKLGEAGKLASTSVGAVALAAGGAAIAVGATAAAIYGLVSSAISLEKEIGPLRKDGLLPPLDPRFKQNLTDTERALAGAGVQAKALVVDIGASLAPAVLTAASLFAKFIEAISKMGPIVEVAGQLLRKGLVFYLQQIGEGLLHLPSLAIKFAGVWGSVLGALGFEDVSKQIKGIEAEFNDWKDSLGETSVAGLEAGLKGVVDFGAVGQDHLIKLGKAAIDLAEGPAEAAKELADTLKELGAIQAQATATFASDEEKALITLEERLAKIQELAAEQKDSAEAQEAAFNAAEAAVAEYTAALNKAAAVRAEAAKKEQEESKKAQEAAKKSADEAAKAAQEFRLGMEDAIASLDELSGKMTDALFAPLRRAFSAAKDLGKGLADVAGIDLSSLTSPQDLLAMAATQVQGQQEAQAGVKQAKADLGSALMSGDAEAIAEAQAGLKAARQELEAASPAGFVNGLVDGAVDLVNGIVENLPKILKNLIKQLPRLIEAIVDGIPQIIIALVRRLPEIAIKLAVAFAVELPIAIIANLPKIVKALALGIGDAFIEAGKSLFRVIKDVFKEIGTGGRADTRTFNDTPGVVRATYEGLNASFAPGDYVAAARTVEGLRAQVNAGPASQAGKAEVKATLDLRDAGLWLDRGLRQNAARGGVLNRTTGRR